MKPEPPSVLRCLMETCVLIGIVFTVWVVVLNAITPGGRT